MTQEFSSFVLAEDFSYLDEIDPQTMQSNFNSLLKKHKIKQVHNKNNG